MLISEFARTTGLSIDTVRFYINKGLLTPERSTKGGGNPYQIFSQSDVTAVRMIRLQQSLGYSLREIQSLNDEYRSSGHSPERTIEVLQTQIQRLETRKASLETALTFLHSKIEWIRSGKPNQAPTLEDYQC